MPNFSPGMMTFVEDSLQENVCVCVCAQACVQVGVCVVVSGEGNIREGRKQRESRKMMCIMRAWNKGRKKHLHFLEPRSDPFSKSFLFPHPGEE